MEIQITITGVTPLICNRFYDEAAMAATNGTRSSATGADRGTPLEQAEKKLYRNADGQLFIPQPNVMRALVDGGRFHKIGKSQVTTATSSLLFACLDIVGTEIPVVHKEPWRVDTRAVVVPSTKGRILTHRPMFDDWELSFEAVLDTSIVSERVFRMCVDDAGKRVGLGDFRPARKGPYGKFVVTEWSVVPQAIAAE